MRQIVIMALVGLLLGLIAGQVIPLISSHANNKLRACAYGCLFGIGLSIAVLFVGYWVYFNNTRGMIL
jgi:ABC-type antimicrobial peptide transport system permease subunit